MIESWWREVAETVLFVGVEECWIDDFLLWKFAHELVIYGTSIRMPKVLAYAFEETEFNYIKYQWWEYEMISKFNLPVQHFTMPEWKRT